MNLRFEEERKREHRIQILKETVYFLIAVVIVVLLAWLVVRFALKKVSVIGSAMETTLYNGQDVIVNKTSYLIFRPKRDALVAFYPEQEEEEEDSSIQKDSTISIRRIIGMPGETVLIKDGIIYIDGKELNEKYDFEEILSPGQANEEITLDSDEYFVLSDKRSDLDDSRSSTFTKVKKKNIIGKVILTLNPFTVPSGPRQDNTEQEEDKES
jgi:signal peptidase I